MRAALFGSIGGAIVAYQFQAFRFHNYVLFVCVYSLPFFLKIPSSPAYYSVLNRDQSFYLTWARPALFSPIRFLLSDFRVGPLLGPCCACATLDAERWKPCWAPAVPLVEFCFTSRHFFEVELQRSRHVWSNPHRFRSRSGLWCNPHRPASGLKLL